MPMVGLVYKGMPGRPNDKVGVAAAVARVGDNARGLDVDTALFGNLYHPVRSSEAMIEMMYQAKLTSWLTVQPELQYIINLGGGVLNPDGTLRKNAWVIGVRSTINF
jgi:porin